MTSARELDAQRTGASIWTWLAWLVAIAGTAGSLYLSLGMNLKPCPLCYYQRAFMLAAFGVLTLGLMTSSGRSTPLAKLVLTIAAGGLGVAIFHIYLEASGKLECPKGIAEIGTAPQQSLAAFALLTLFLILDALKKRDDEEGSALLMTLGALILGGAMAWAGIKSAPPLPARDKPYDAEKEPLVGCRPTYQEPPSEQ